MQNTKIRILCCHRSVIAGVIHQHGGEKDCDEKFAARGRKEKIREEVTLRVDMTAVLNVMETLHLSYEDAVSELKIPAERQAAVLKKVLEQKQND